MLEAEPRNGGEVGRSTTPEVEPPVVEALTPPSTMEELIKSGGIETGDELAGLENLEPEIVALLKADIGLKNSDAGESKGSVDEYAP